MIIWLASYPKSGNTLLRGILATYFFSKDGNFDFNHLYKIGQFPSYKHFHDLKIDISDDNQIYSNLIKAQQLNSEGSSVLLDVKTQPELKMSTYEDLL